MPVTSWSIRLALGFVFCIGALGCHLTDTYLAQATVAPTRTRTVKPTFTVIPSPTVTPIPPTAPPSPTLKPTVKPTVKPPPTKPPPTKPPVAPPPPSGPTASTYEWHVNSPGCEHSGGVYVKARVYGDKNNPDSGVEGVRVVLGDGSGNRFDIPPVTTTWDGTYSFTLSGDGETPYKGKVYVWLIDANGKRISDLGGPMNFDGGDCWHGWVDFWK